jgi:hypothetical protein
MAEYAISSLLALAQAFDAKLAQSNISQRYAGKGASISGRTLCSGGGCIRGAATYLDDGDAEKCILGEKCVGLSIEIAQFRGNIERIPGDR